MGTISAFATTMYNPLDLLINDLVEFTFDDEVGVYDIDQIVAYTTDYGDRTVQAVRYFLQDVEAEEETDPLVLEMLKPEEPDTASKYVLFAITEAFEYDEEFVKLLDDEIFIISEGDEDSEKVEEVQYQKISQAIARISVLDEHNEVNPGEVEIWTYQREHDGDLWYLSIEIDRDDGWTTFYEGYPLAEGEWQLARLSEDV